MRRFIRFTFKATLLVGALAVVVVVARKLMGGLGSKSGAPSGSADWPSLVPEPATKPAPSASTSGNGAGGNGASSNETASADAES